MQCEKFISDRVGREVSYVTRNDCSTGKIDLILFYCKYYPDFFIALEAKITFFIFLITSDEIICILRDLNVCRSLTLIYAKVYRNNARCCSYIIITTDSNYRLIIKNFNVICSEKNHFHRWFEQQKHLKLESKNKILNFPSVIYAEIRHKMDIVNK